jgi:hypothetical protein
LTPSVTRRTSTFTTPRLMFTRVSHTVVLEYLWTESNRRVTEAAKH